MRLSPNGSLSMGVSLADIVDRLPRVGDLVPMPVNSVIHRYGLVMSESADGDFEIYLDWIHGVYSIRKMTGMLLALNIAAVPLEFRKEQIIRDSLSHTGSYPEERL